MITIIAGSRSITRYRFLLNAINSAPFNVTKVISGTANGVDQMGERYARLKNIPLVQVPADWKKLGKQAGYIRNQQMADIAEALIALWDGESNGTKHMIDIANKKGLMVHVVNIPKFDRYHLYELMDRASIFADMWDDNILDSPVLVHEKDLQHLANSIMDDLAAFYQMSGATFAKYLRKKG